MTDTEGCIQSMDPLARNLGEVNIGGCKAIQAQTEEVRTQAVQTSINRDEHGGYRDCSLQRDGSIIISPTRKYISYWLGCGLVCN